MVSLPTKSIDCMHSPTLSRSFCLGRGFDRLLICGRDGCCNEGAMNSRLTRVSSFEEDKEVFILQLTKIGTNPPLSLISNISSSESPILDPFPSTSGTEHMDGL